MTRKSTTGTSQYRILPDGNVTKSTTRYIRAWRKLGKDVSKALGGDWALIAFDPCITLCSKLPRSRRTLQLDRDIAQKIAELGRMSIEQEAVIANLTRQLTEIRANIADLHKAGRIH